MPPPVDDTTEIVIGWIMKIGGAFITFLGGIVTATAAVTLKLKGYDDRIGNLELNQRRCQSEVLKSIADKLDELPDTIGDRMENKFNRVHDRIDTLILKEKTHDDASVKRDNLTLKNIEVVREKQS
jgi:hypothetical protein